MRGVAQDTNLKLIQSTRSVDVAGGNTTLEIADHLVIFTGSNANDVVASFPNMLAANTRAGYEYLFINNSNTVVHIARVSTNRIRTMGPGEKIVVRLTDASTSDGVWEYSTYQEEPQHLHKNLVKNPKIENATTGNNVAPFISNASGGGAVTRTAGEVISGLRSYRIVGQGATTFQAAFDCFDIDEADAGLSMVAYVTTKTLTALSGDFEIGIYDVTNTSDIVESFVPVPLGITRDMPIQFITRSTSLSYQIKIRQVGNHTRTASVDNLYMGRLTSMYDKEMRGFIVLGIASNVAQLSPGSVFMPDGRELYLASTLELNLKTEVHAHGVTTPDADTRYYLYIDLTRLPASSEVGVADRKVYVPDLDSFIVFPLAPDEIVDLSRYLPISALKTNGSSDYTLFENISNKRHPNNSVVVSPLVYSDTDRSVGTVGSAGQLVTQGPLIDAEFPGIANSSYFHLAGDSLHKNTSGDTGDLTQVGSPSFLSKGFFGRSNVIYFDGVDDRLTSGNTHMRPGANTSWSVGGWVSAADWTGVAAQQTIFSSNGNTSTDIGTNIAIISGQGISFRASSAGTANDVDVFVSANFAPHSWHHLAWVYNFSTTTLTAYIDGQIVKRATLANTRSGATAQFGARNTTPELFFRGSMQDMFFSNGNALTPSQINNLYSKRYSGSQIAMGHKLDADSFPLTNANLSWYNLLNVNDGSGNARHLTNNNSIVFTAPGLSGVTNIANLNGTNHSLSSTDAFFNPGDNNFICGGWFRANNWNTGAVQVLMGNYPTTSDRGWVVYIQNDGSLRLTVATSPTTEEPIVNAGNILTNGWYHVAVRYTAGSKLYELFVNGISVGSATNEIANRAVTSSIFRLGAHQTSAVSFFGGAISDFFYARAIVSNDDLTKIVSACIELPAPAAAVPVKNALWGANTKREDDRNLSQLPDTDWLIDKRVGGKIYVNFALDPSMSVDLFMSDSGSSLATIPRHNYEAVFTSAPGATIPHGLPRMPASVSLLHDENGDGRYVELEASNYVKQDGTNLYFDSAAIAMLTIDASHPLIVVASVGAVPSAQRQVTTIAVSSNITLEDGLKYMVDCSSARTLTLPPSPGFGDEVLVQDATGQSGANNITVGRNGQNIDGLAEDFIIDVNGGWVKFKYYNVTRGWITKE